MPFIKRRPGRMPTIDPKWGIFLVFVIYMGVWVALTS